MARKHLLEVQHNHTKMDDLKKQQDEDYKTLQIHYKKLKAKVQEEHERIIKHESRIHEEANVLMN